VIIEMTLVRVIGRRSELSRTLSVLQDLGTLHLIEPAVGRAVVPHAADAAERRRRRAVERALADVEEAIAALSTLDAAVPADDGAPIDVAHAACRAARVRVRAARLAERRRDLRDDRETLRAYAPLLDQLEALVRGAWARRRFSAYLLRLRHVDAATLDRLRAALDRALAREHELRSHPLPDGEVALLLLVGAGRAAEVERLLGEARIESAPLPPALGAANLIDDLPRLRARLAEIEHELRGVGAEIAALAAADGKPLARARRALHDERVALDARARAAETAHAFVIEGWIPARGLPALTARVRERLGGEVEIEVVTRDAWHGSEAPVVLANPPLFAPFERLTALLPLPRYGTVDPTPFVAVFFPMLFGVIVGDVGYGLLLALISLILWRRGPERGLARDLARIAAAVASYTVIFGVLYGEAFGDLGAHLVGMRPIWLDREEAILPFLGAAVAIGVVHLVLGLVVGAIDRRRKPREAAGRGLTALMLALVAVALLAVFDLLPGALFTPAIVALLVAFPVLLLLEGFTALLELVTTLGHVLSYARVMALGTASVMLAVVANRMVGAFGGAAIGVIFALLFHLVNFAIAMFSPTVHVLRLHYVEFFGTFFSPGGSRYQPFAHWTG
jgi:V/A-type H+-transporting ATPase subunit I